MVKLEADAATVRAENDQLHAEHRRLVHNATALGDELATLRAHYARDVGEARSALAAAQREAAAALAKLADLPARSAAAERVAESFTTTKSGSGGAHGFIDGAAYDAWKAAR
jgi:hypothetical protein